MGDSKKSTLSTAAVCFPLLLLLALPASASDPRPGEPGYAPPQTPQQLTRSHFGSSPFHPPELNDTLFLVDRAPGLDTGCAFRSQGPLLFSIEIDRVIGNRDLLVQSGLLAPTATLRMPAFDVDSGANIPGINPERDRVWFNGNVVPTEFLTGENNTWKFNSFTIPIDWVNFPADPGRGGTPAPAANLVRIDIDVANEDENWCTQIDWATLSIEVARPVVMAHGIFSDGGIWNKLWVPELQKLGLPSSNALDMGNLDGIAQNAQKIAAEVAEAKRRWGVDKVVLVGHSKGGLDSRHYAENRDDVSQLIQLGTPNAGSRLADIAQGILVVGLGLPKAAVVNALAGPGGIQLTRPYMKRYNRFHGSNAEVDYTALAGDYDPDCFLLNVFCRPLERLLLLASGSPGDTIVTVSSVHALAYTDDRIHPSKGADPAATHSGLHGSRDVFNRLRDRIGSTSKRASMALLRARLFGPAEENADKTKGSEPVLGATGALAGEISQGQTRQHTLPLAESEPTAVTLFYPSGNLDLVLVSPSGQVIDPTVAATDPDVDHEDRVVEGGRAEVYGLRQPEVGTWTLRVSAPSVVEPSGSAAYAAVALFENPEIELGVEVLRESVHSGEPLDLRASLSENGIPPAAAAVTAVVALPDGSEQTLALRDDGAGIDPVAGDGVYNGRFVGTTQAGNYRICFEAERNGSVAGPDFSRSDFVLATVSASDSTFTGAFADFGIDLDGDGQFDELVIEADLSVTASADYRLFAALEDGAGHRLETDAELTLGPGLHTASLSFDGEDLFRNGVDGPYSLVEIRMAEVGENEILPVSEQINAHETAAYGFGQFEHGPVVFTGQGGAGGVDSDGNGLYDRLEVTVEVMVDVAGRYEWSARLVDSRGRELGFAAASAFFSAGTNQLTFSFDGEAIGSSGADGPYFVTDLLLLGGGTSVVRFQVFETPAFEASQFEGSQNVVFVDGFESGNTSSWSRTIP